MKSGDALSKISQNYDTPVQDLVKYNNIRDPNQSYRSRLGDFIFR
ncbi:putative lysozyme [Rickettsia conorii subsp. heilongjiangensis 054]|nr:putative lysozyme [Rickettsia conorii subsp. heilongjiangensis 054]